MKIANFSVANMVYIYRCFGTRYFILYMKFHLWLNAYQLF